MSNSAISELRESPFGDSGFAASFAAARLGCGVSGQLRRRSARPDERPQRDSSCVQRSAVCLESDRRSRLRQRMVPRRTQSPGASNLAPRLLGHLHRSSCDPWALNHKIRTHAFTAEKKMNRGFVARISYASGNRSRERGSGCGSLRVSTKNPAAFNASTMA